MIPLHELIPTGKQIVVLDTSVARNLVYTDTSATWVDIFAEMSRNDYSFSLADNAFAELVAQISSGAISTNQKILMIERLRRFLNVNLPIFLGKIDISILIGMVEPHPDWSTTNVLELSSRAWNYLTNCSITAQSNQSGVHEDLQSERQAWVSMIQNKGLTTGEPLHEYKHTQLEKVFADIDDLAPHLSPSLSIRMDLQIRLLWRQYVRSNKDVEPYDPLSSKNKNDGIDFDIYNYLLIPALIVTQDEGFFRKLKDIDSFQKQWFLKPEDLAKAWSDRTPSRARWPGT